MRRLGLLFLIFLVACAAPASLTPGADTHAAFPGAYLRAPVKIVDVRPNAATNFTAASDGQKLSEQAEVRTGSNSRTRLDFGGGAVVRLSQNTWVGIDAVSAAAAGALTRLNFKAGKVTVSLAGGELAATTPLGQASVHGSYAVFQYDPGRDPNTTQDDVLTIQCIEGACAYNNNNDQISLGNLQQLIVSNRGLVLTGPTDLSPAVLADFLANNPERAAVVLSLTAARPAATLSPTVTPAAPTPRPTIGLPVDTGTATTLPASETLAASATATKTRRPPTFLPSDTPPPADTDTPQPPPTPAATDTAQPPPPPRPTDTHLPPTQAPTVLPTEPPTAAPTQAPTNPPPTNPPTRPPPATKTPPP